MPPRPPLPSAHTHLQIYVLPTLHGKHVFHPRFLKPQTRLQHIALVSAFIFRKWRYQLSDVGAFVWNGAGASTGFVGRKLWWWGNKLTTRRAADEYFLKNVPRITESVEFLYPPSSNLKMIKAQIGEFLANGDRHRSRLFLWALILPSSLYIGKFHVAVANLFFSYNVFRLNASWRAMYGAKTLQKLLDSRKVTWKADDQLQTLIESSSQEVTARLEETANGGKIWRYSPGADLHDEVVERLEKELKSVELSRTYRRSRLQYLVHQGKE
ncbi:hypothetical protein HDU85_002722 [Gaertneriomyces sp. JEL0708]|nr:hypothetical protein HDU85_002722 [Gaertneriomyces sp. JEL0708]